MPSPGCGGEAAFLSPRCDSGDDQIFGSGRRMLAQTRPTRSHTSFRSSTYMYMHIYRSNSMHTYMYTCSHEYETYQHACFGKIAGMHEYMHKYVHTHACMHSRTDARTDACTHIFAEGLQHKSVMQVALLQETKFQSYCPIVFAH